MLNKKTSLLYQTRYCAQEDFNIAVCINNSKKVLESPNILNSYENSKQIDFITKRRYNSKVVASGSSLFVINKSMGHLGKFEERLDPSENNVVLPPFFKKLTNFCVCSFMQKIYVIGGCKKFEEENFYSTIASFMCYDI